MSIQQLSDNLFLVEDTCNVYVLKSGGEAITVDFGSGEVLNRLDEIGIERVTDVLMTHHHRDQGQGLPLAVEAGAHIYVPYTEQDLFHSVDIHWQAREIARNYNMREDRFSLVEPVPVAGMLQDYATGAFGRYTIKVVPTPGHTIGSISLLTRVDGQDVAFTGDLIAAPGQVWSLAATQWSYNGAEGVASSVASLLSLRKHPLDLLLPSHGVPIPEPEEAISLLIQRMWRLLQARQENPRLFQLHDKPYVRVTPHLLFNRTSMANCYVLLSESGKALFLDFGFDFMTGAGAGFDRASRRPWLYTLPALKEQFGVSEIDVVIPTHVHDDHVAGINLLRDVEGTEVWVPSFFADILERPSRYDLPCLWYDPIPVDRRLPLNETIRWQEYELQVYAQPGHTRYAVAIALEVDRKRILAVGDQYEGGTRWNYVYRNRFDAKDYQRSANLYSSLQPDLLLFGHHDPLWVTPEYLEQLVREGTLLDELHSALLYAENGPQAEGSLVRVMPYFNEVCSSKSEEVQIEIRNPARQPQYAVVRLVAPRNWRVDPEETSCILEPLETGEVTVQVTPVGPPTRRARLVADVTLGGHHFGQIAEALWTIRG